MLTRAQVIDAANALTIRRRDFGLGAPIMMSTAEQRITANRANAQFSTGPATADGKAVASRNATRHGLLSTKLFLDDEDSAEFLTLAKGLAASLTPVGALEGTLVERIAVTIWRQRRLVQAETASLSLARQPRKIAIGVGSELGRSELRQDELVPFDADRERWCRQVIAELDQLSDYSIETLERQAPLTYQQLQSDAGEDQETPDKFIADHKGSLVGYIAGLTRWCREQCSEAEARPHRLELAEQVMAKRLVLPTEALELLARYQTTLDNQLFRLLRALRDAQEWRLRTLEPAARSVDEPEAGAAQAA
jgi:hypothetical protein